MAFITEPRLSKSTSQMSAVDFKKLVDTWWAVTPQDALVSARIVFDLAEAIYGLKCDLEELKASK